MEIVDWIVDILFILDLFVNFFMAYERRDGTSETRMKFIAKDYLRSWFFVDLIACIPV